MLRRSLIVSGLLSGIWLLLGASPAGATLSPECDASATLSGDDGTTVEVDAETTGRVKIPRKASVSYEGSIDLPEGEEYTHSGGVTLDVAPGFDLIPGLDDPNIASWSWGGDTDDVATTGDTSYDLDLPADFLGGVKATAEGSHTQGTITCTGSLDVEIGGSAVNPVSVGSAAVTAVAAAGLGLAALGKPA